jgi:hypothetical protein
MDITPQDRSSLRGHARWAEETGLSVNLEIERQRLADRKLTDTLSLKRVTFMGIYVIAPHAEGPCKIGISDNLKKRLGGIQVGNWVKLHAPHVAYFRPPEFRGTPMEAYREINRVAVAVEARCHQELGRMDLGLSGEWFAITVEEAIRVVGKCAALVGAVPLVASDLIIGPKTDPGMRDDMVRRMKSSLAEAAAGAQAISLATL